MITSPSYVKYNGDKDKNNYIYYHKEFVKNLIDKCFTVCHVKVTLRGSDIYGTNNGEFPNGWRFKKEHGKNIAIGKHKTGKYWNG